MSLLQDNDYSSDDDDLFATKDSSGRSSGKTKKSDKKARSGEDKKSTRIKNKDNVVKEKTPKKGKAQATKSSTSWSPPDSPKQTSLPSEAKTSVLLRTPVNAAGAGAGVGGGQLQPSPNVKNQRKRYSQLASSSEDEEGDVRGVLSNKPVLHDHQVDGGMSDPSSGFSQQQQSTNPFLMDNTSQLFGNNAGLATTTISSDINSSLGASIAWPSLEQQQQQQQQPWVPMMPSGVSGGMGSVNPLLFTADFDSPNQQQQQQQQQASLAFDPNSTGHNVGFEHAPIQPAAAAATTMPPQHGPWGVVDDPFKTTNIAQLLQPLVAQQQPAAETSTGEADTNPFRRPVWHAPQPPEANTSVGMSTTEMPVQSSDVTPPPAAVAPPLSGEDWSVSEDLCGKCVQQFHTLQPVNGVLEGDKARQFFGQSKLPYQELSAIWRLSDIDQDNALSQKEFCIAMKLVLMRRKGVAIPTSLPEPLASLNLGCSDWTTSTAPTSSTSVARESVSPSMDDPRETSPTLVDLQEPRSADQDSLLVVLDDSSIGVLDSSTGQDQTSPNPAIGRIISLDSDSGANEEEEEEDAVLVRLDDKPASKPSKPSKPAPPKPRVPKFNRPPPPAAAKKKTAPTAAVSKVSSSGEPSSSSSSQTSPPHPSSSPPPITSSSDMAPHTTDSRTTSHPPPKPPRPQTVPSKKSSYMALLSSPVDQSQSDQSESPVPDGVGGSRDHAPRPATGGESEGTFQFKPLADIGVPSSSADESSDKGHSRSTSLDLNKMMGTAKSGDVFGGLPSAVPPKPPPKLKRVSSPPPDSLVKVPEAGELGMAPPMGQPRPRSLSTGSLASTGGGAGGPGPVMDDSSLLVDVSADALLLHSLMDTSSDALLLRTTPPPKPKPRKAPLLPPKPTSFPSTSSGNNSSNSSTTSSAAAPSTITTTSSRNLTSSLGSKHATKTNRSLEGAGTSALRRTGPQNRANLAELYQQGEVDLEDSTTSLSTRLVGADSDRAGGSGKSKSSSTGVGSGVKDKTELKASIRSLKENNEALQDINKTLEQKLFQLMDERVRLSRELDLLNALS